MLHDIFFYHPQTVLVLIPLLAIAGWFFTKWHNTNVQFEMARTGKIEVMEELRDAVLRLEQRVENLERAAVTAETERRYAL